jgi:tetratricopeptide (TPR) repeat protein
MTRIADRTKVSGLLALIFAWQMIGTQPVLADYTNPSFDRGVDQMHHRNFDDAILSFNEAIGTSETDSRAYFRRAQCFYFLQNFPLAIADFTQAVTNSPDNPHYYVWRGTAYAKTGQDDLAIRDYEKAINLNPHLKEAFERSLNQPDPTETVTSTSTTTTATGKTIKTQKIAVQPAFGGMEESDVFMTKHFRSPAGESNNAVRDYREAMRRARHSTTAYFNAGTVYSGIADPEKNVTDASRAARVPEDVIVEDHNGTPFYSLKNARSQFAESIDAINVEPNRPENYYKRARAREQLGDKDRALADLNRAIDLFPDNVEFYLARAFLYHQQNRESLAADDIKRAQAMDLTLPREISFEPTPPAAPGASDELGVGDQLRRHQSKEANEIRNNTAPGVTRIESNN